MQSLKNILITGGGGLIGRKLTPLLLERGYAVSHLNRKRRNSDVKTFLWDPAKGKIDVDALRGIDAIIHLAGAGIADHRWNAKIKEEILSSRTVSARLLRESLTTQPHPIAVFVSASGISYYGLEDKPEPFIETDPPADDFMARVVIAWEDEARKFESSGSRVVMLRTGVVLSKEGGALKKLETPIKFFAGAPLGSGRQYVNWIHIDDLCLMYLMALENPSMKGPYNAVAPNPVTNRTLTTAIAKVLKKPLWLPPVPGFVVKLIAGQVATLVLKGDRVSCSKIEEQGFQFHFRTIEDALKALYVHQPDHRD
jgi:uncharacterized protein (TIGR01777 family)